jgi:hypothetical protein
LLGSKFGSSGPTAVFTLNARTVTTLTAGQRIPIDITLNYDTQRSSLPSMPLVQLLEMRYELKATTNTLTRSFMIPDWYNHDQATVFESELHFPQTFLSDNQLLNVGTVDEAGNVQSIYFDKVVVPPFKTYNISRSYDVAITLVVQCDGKQMTAEFNWPNAYVLFNDMYHHPTHFAPREPEGVRKRVVAGAVAAVIVGTAAAILGA